MMLMIACLPLSSSLHVEMKYAAENCLRRDISCMSIVELFDE